MAQEIKSFYASMRTCSIPNGSWVQVGIWFNGKMIAQQHKNKTKHKRHETNANTRKAEKGEVLELAGQLIYLNW